MSKVKLTVKRDGNNFCFDFVGTKTGTTFILDKAKFNLLQKFFNPKSIKL